MEGLQIENMSFAFGTVIQIITIVGVSLSGIFYLRRGFELNRARLDAMEKQYTQMGENFVAHRDDLKESLQSMHRKLDNNHAALHNVQLELGKQSGKLHGHEGRISGIEHVQNHLRVAQG